MNSLFSTIKCSHQLSVLWSLDLSLSLFFFFSSRRRHTRSYGDWSSDVCSSDLILISNLMAILLQTLSARLGIVTGRDLAQACRDHYPRPIVWALWILCEIAIAA